MEFVNLENIIVVEIFAIHNIMSVDNKEFGTELEFHRKPQTGDLIELQGGLIGIFLGVENQSAMGNNVYFNHILTEDGAKLYSRARPIKIISELQDT